MSPHLPEPMPTMPPYRNQPPMVMGRNPIPAARSLGVSMSDAINGFQCLARAAGATYVCDDSEDDYSARRAALGMAGADVRSSAECAALQGIEASAWGSDDWRSAVPQLSWQQPMADDYDPLRVARERPQLWAQQQRFWASRWAQVWGGLLPGEEIVHTTHRRSCGTNSTGPG